MEWVKLTLHFPSFYSYRIPGHSSQYALSLPLPSPSAIKLGLVATAIRSSGKIKEGEKAFYELRDADIRVQPPGKIVINSFLIKRLKKKKNPTETQSFEKTFGVREYVYFSDDVCIYIGNEDLSYLAKYFKMLRYLGTGDSLLFVKNVSYCSKPPKNAIKPMSASESAKLLLKDLFVLYPVKDLSKNATFEHVNPLIKKTAKNTFDRKYYLIKANVRHGKNWTILEVN